MRVLTKVALGVVGVVVLYIVGQQLHGMTHHPVSVAQKVAAHPPPTLFNQAAMTPYAAQLDRQGAEATQLMQGWWRAHGTKADDKKFLAWVDATMPAPPSAGSREAEAKQLEKLVATNTAKGKKAAHWLQTYGGRDLWQFYEHKQAAQLPQSQQGTRHKQLLQLLTMVHAEAKSMSDRLQQPAPSRIDPALAKGKSVPAGKACPCSYPAGAVASSAAGRTFLSFFYPQQATLYKHMTDELGFAQVYLGNHLPSDVDAGSLLGDMVGDYFLVTRDHAQLPQVSAALAG